MAINKAMQLALKALSYPEIDIRETYKAKRSLANIYLPALNPLYKLFDRKILSNGREINARLYPPRDSSRKLLILFFHGGGWVTESVDTYNNVCKTLAKQTNAKVISVEYSLAPEHKFPVGVEDCYAAAKDVHLYPELYDADGYEIVLAGDSAGGNLAAAVSLMARDRGEFKVKEQILIYPSTYHDHGENSPYASVHTNATGYLLTSKHICEYIELYKGSDDDLLNPYFAPLLSKDLSDQPRTLIITAEFDPLRDEGEAYGTALAAAGNTVRVYRMKDALHGFFSLDYRFPHVKRSYKLIDDFLKHHN